jgi:hypothetical protein
MQIDESEEQDRNADASIRKSLEPGSNVTLESALHSVKQPWQRSSTDDGMQIDESDEQDENAHASIRETLQPDSNLTLETDLFRKKHRQPRVSIESGIMIAAECPKYLMIDVHSKFTKNTDLI